MQPVMTTIPPTWPQAVWIGELDLERPPATASIPLESVGSASRARFLVRDALSVRGFVTVPVVNEAVELDALLTAARALSPGAAVEPPDDDVPSVSVVICTRDRTDLLADAVASVLALDPPVHEVVVVDNAPSSDATGRWAETVTDPRVRRLLEAEPGVSRGRTTGARAASGDIVLFLDDDVVADRHLVSGLRAAFARHPRVGVICGMVPTGELRTATQAWFDHRVTWADNLRPRVFDLAAPPADVPLFPFQVGAYGTGAMMAVRRDLGEQLGWFDPALGPGTPALAGEDIDLFVRALYAGAALVNEPSAIAWHRHRADLPALEKQARGYGTGLGAWLAKVALDRPQRADAVRRLARGARRMGQLARGGSDRPTDIDAEFGLPAGYTARLGRLEVRSAAAGPLAYARARRAVRDRARQS